MLLIQQTQSNTSDCTGWKLGFFILFFIFLITCAVVLLLYWCNVRKKDDEIESYKRSLDALYPETKKISKLTHEVSFLKKEIIRLQNKKIRRKTK